MKVYIRQTISFLRMSKSGWQVIERFSRTMCGCYLAPPPFPSGGGGGGGGGGARVRSGATTQTLQGDLDIQLYIRTL